MPVGTLYFLLSLGDPGIAPAPLSPVAALWGDVPRCLGAVWSLGMGSGFGLIFLGVGD